jgi:hypothetical protein
MKIAAGLFLIVLGFSCRPGFAASTYVMEYMTITASSVGTDSETEMDYNTEQSYCAVADGYLIVNGSIIKQGSASAGTSVYDGADICGGTVGSTASLSMLVAAVPNTAYEMQTNHWLLAAYFYGVCDPYPTNCDIYYYDDPYGYSKLTAQNFAGLGTVNAPGTAEYPDDYSYSIASTYLYGTSSTHVSVVSDQVGVPAACNGGPGVFIRQTELQLVTGSNVPITTSIPVGETLTNVTTNTCSNGGVPVAGPCAAAAGGQFQDFQAVRGNPANPSSFCVSEPAGCGFTLTSIWSACGIGLTNNIWTSPRVVHSNGITMNGSSTKFPVGTQLYP